MKRTLFLSRKFLKVEKKQCQDTKGFMKHTDQPKTQVTVKYKIFINLEFNTAVFCVSLSTY